MLNEHTLYDYLFQLDRDAEEMFNLLVKQITERKSISEELKAEKQIEWVGQMNNIRQRAREVINNELIYV